MALNSVTRSSNLHPPPSSLRKIENPFRERWLQLGISLLQQPLILLLHSFVKNIPPDDQESVSDTVENFFLVNHHDNYLTHQLDNMNKFKDHESWEIIHIPDKAPFPPHQQPAGK
ncbi:hypothetical protein L1987_58494 [Smallanthus sonchifolius]|uniref:Uncharacterized protein n=1 Tax=Smallanthus sonchifolius TaxID=185202 RepID=A0ACB9DG97_9ASTR|nr:hypothetical protein L1987_58494 [Smallanthus sonchifolius]